MRIRHITNTSYIIILLRCQLSFLHHWSPQSGTFCERKKQRASHYWASPIAQLLFLRRKGWVNSNEKIFPPGKMWSVRLRTWWEQGLETWGLCVGSVSTHWTSDIMRVFYVSVYSKWKDGINVPGRREDEGGHTYLQSSDTPKVLQTTE